MVRVLYNSISVTHKLKLLHRFTETFIFLPQIHLLYIYEIISFTIEVALIDQEFNLLLDNNPNMKLIFDAQILSYYTSVSNIG